MSIMRGMKILLINYMETTAPGGINKIVRETAKHFSKNGHEVQVLQPNPLGLLPKEVLDGFTITRLSTRIGKYAYGYSPDLMTEVSHFITAFKPDVVHVHGYHTLFTLGVIRKIRVTNATIPIIFSPHMDSTASTLGGNLIFLYHKLFGQTIFDTVDYVFAGSNFERENICNNIKISKDKIAIIPLGVDSIVPKQYHKRNDKIRLLFVGYLIRRKNVGAIFDVLDTVIHKYNVEDISLTIIGNGPEKEKLIRYAGDLQIQNHIIWKKSLDKIQLEDEIKSSDYLLLLSSSEAFGIIVAETLALGTPTIVTDTTALSEFASEPGCFAVPYPPDPNEIARQILSTEQLNIGPFSERIRIWSGVADDYISIYVRHIRG